MEFRLLGPVEVWAEGRRLDAGQPRQRCVLAALLADPGRLVGWETLVERVYGEMPMDAARKSLYSHIARLRRMLAGAGSRALVYRTGGYELDIEPECVDLHRFRRLVTGAREPDLSDTQRVAQLREAIDLWRGDALAGLDGLWAARSREGWRRQYLDAVLTWADAETRLGNPAIVIAPLSELLGEFPLVEPVTAGLMRALHAAGDTERALRSYAATRQRLVEVLGVDPAAELRELHVQILRGPVHAGATEQELPQHGSRQIPAQLPSDIPGFVGRAEELARFAAVHASAADSSASVILAVLGTAGVGKTTLAVHWAHMVKQRFPDGQLYVNLRGFDPGGTATTPSEAIRGFLDAFAVAPQRIPAGLDAQAGLYRSLLAGRRVLIMLDNARDSEQVRPLLPGTPGCVAVVTSRSDLSGLISTECAYPITLDVMSPEEARQLLATRIGPGPVAAEPEAVNEIATRCARLPLALAIVAARAATHPSFPLRALAAQMSDASESLDALAGRDPAIDVRAVFSWSYRTLSAAAALLFRQLSIHPGPDIGAAAAASLAAVPVKNALALLTELASVHLVVEHAPGRFTFHDLLRAYAGDLANSEDREADRHAALHRVLDHYLHAAHTADRLLHPNRDPIVLDPPEPGVIVRPIRDGAAALAWFATEHRTLLAAVGQAAVSGLDAHAWRIAWSLDTYLGRRGHWHDWADSQRIALEAAGRLPNATSRAAAQAHAHRGIGGAYIWLGRYDEAHTHLRCALELSAELGLHTDRAHLYVDIGWMFERQDRHYEAIDSATKALELYVAAGRQAGQARALNAIGWSHALLGNHQQSISHCRQALRLLQEIGDRPGEAHTWDSLGYAHHHDGDHVVAVSCYEHAIAIFRDLGDKYYEADTLIRLGDTHRARGVLPATRASWQLALEILERLEHPDAKQVRVKLEDLEPITQPW